MNKKIHLHPYDTMHKSYCPYCSYQLLRRAREIRSPTEIYEASISKNLSSIVKEMSKEVCKNINTQGIVLVTHPATRDLNDIEPYLINFIEEIDSSIDGRNLLIKANPISFSQGGNKGLTYEEKSSKVEVNKNVLSGMEINKINSVIIIDDTYDTGVSYQITLDKLKEIGITTQQVMLATILEIAPLPASS